MRFGILGTLEVRDDAGTPLTVAGPRPRALLVMLLLQPNRTVGVDALIAGQYGDEPPAGAIGALQAHVSRLRRTVPVEFDGAGYRLAVDPDDVDAHRFELLAEAGRRLLHGGDHAGAVALLRRAVALWRGPALVDLPYGEAQAARLAELRLAAIEDLVDAELALPEGTSVAELRALVAAHPLRERLRGQLMRALQRNGRQAEALAEYENTRRLLADELGADPSPELAATHLAILRADRPPRRRLPAQLTSFVGREEELARLAELRSARLVTLTGPGGVGKTRLAIEAARGRDACFVDLSPVEDGALVPHALLTALGLRESGFLPATAHPVRRLVAALDRSLLLVLDNCEQVVEAVAALARTLLAERPDVAVVATSREPLGLTGETLLPLAPLPDDLGTLLFAARAAAVRPGFAVTEENVETVRSVCAGLDGLPLAIELAAARLRQFSLDELASRLAVDGPFRLLSRGDRTAAARHRTLAAVVEWSWDLLGEEERSVAARFSVFSGSASLAAAETVCATTDDVLADLVDRSLVETDGRRYRMLETVRLFCAERAAEDARRRHAEYFLALALRADPHLRRAEQLEWLRKLSVEHDNLMAALRWAVRADRVTAFRLVAALTAYWWLSGRRSQAGAAAAALIDGEVPKGLDEEYVSCVLHAAPRASAEHWERAREIMRSRGEALRHPFVAAVWGMAVGPWMTELGPGAAAVKPGSAAGPEPGSGTAAGSGPTAGPEPAGLGPGPESGSAAEPKSGPGPKPRLEPTPEPAPEPGQEPRPEAATNPTSEPVPAPRPEPAPTPVPKPRPVRMPERGPATDPTLELELEPAPTPAPRPRSRRTSAPQPGSRPKAGPVAEAEPPLDTSSYRSTHRSVYRSASPLLGNDPWSLALGRLSHGLLLAMGGRPAEGEAELRAVLTTFRGLGERWGMAQALDWLGELTGWRGEWTRAHELWSESLALYEEFGALEECVDVLCRRASCALRQGSLDTAAGDYARAGELSARAGRPDAAAVLGLAEVTRQRAAASSDVALAEAARASVTAALAATDDVFVGTTVRARLLTCLGYLTGDAEHHRAAVRTARQFPLTSELAHAIEGLASTAPPDRAAQLLGTGTALRGTALTGDTDVAATKARATDALGAEKFTSAYTRAAAQSPEDALISLDRRH